MKGSSLSVCSAAAASFFAFFDFFGTALAAEEGLPGFPPFFVAAFAFPIFEGLFFFFFFPVPFPPDGEVSPNSSKVPHAAFPPSTPPSSSPSGKRGDRWASYSGPRGTTDTDIATAPSTASTASSK